MQPQWWVFGFPIAQTFPDGNMAQAVATKLGFPTSHVITQSDIDNATFWSVGFSNKSIVDISGIEYFVNSTYLDVSFNKITSVLDGIEDLINSKTLNLYVNQIAVLPDSIGSLHNLNELYLASCQLTSLPNSFVQLTALTGLSLLNNLLPSDYPIALNDANILGGNVVYQTQDQLEVNGPPPAINVLNQASIDTIDYLSFLSLSSGDLLSENHSYILENYSDENNHLVNIDDYLKNGIVIKSGTGHVLPKTGGNTALLISLLTLGSGLVFSTIGYKKNK